MAHFEHQFADRLLMLQNELETRAYQPGRYFHFMIHDPKLRKISATPFRDCMVHHALCNLIEPLFERSFISDSYANRVGKGTHRAVDRLQFFAKRFRYILRCDIVKFFPSVDHAILKHTLGEAVHDQDTAWLAEVILSSGAGVLADEYDMVYFPGDNLFAVNRPRGLPIGNLTSQFWANCYMNPFDHFIKRELRCRAYLRYVDDFSLFSDSKAQLWEWKDALIERLAKLRLVVHETEAQVMPVSAGIPWLGFVVYPTHRRIKSRNVVKFSRRLRKRWGEYTSGQISFAEFDASVQGWINHVRYADTWGLRKHILGQPLVGKI